MKHGAVFCKTVSLSAALALASAAAAQGAATSRDPAQPSVLLVQGLTRPFHAIVGDIVRFVLTPSTRPGEPMSGVTVTGIPRLKTIAESGPYVIEWDTAGYSPGIYRLRQATVLPNGARMMGPIVETELLQEPPLSIQAPPEPTGSFEVAVSARGDYKPKRVELLVDGQSAGGPSSLPGQVKIDSATLACGPHVLWARAIDAKEREFISQPVSFNLPEVVKLTQPNSESQVVTDAGSAELRLAAEHNLGEKVKRLEFLLDGQVVGEDDAKPYESSYRGPLSSGMHRLAVTAELETGESIRSREVTIYAMTQERSTAPAAGELLARIKPALVLVETTKPDSKQTASASGFFINDAGYLVTSNHVTEGASVIFARFADGARMRARVAARDLTEDLAVLVVQREGQEPIPLGEERTAKEGVEVGVGGYPYAESLKELGLGVVPSFYFGTINALRPTRNEAGLPAVRLQFDARIAPGLSGAPLFEKGSGKVVGVVRSGVVGEISGQTAINLAVSVDSLRRLLRRAGIAYTQEWRR